MKLSRRNVLAGLGGLAVGGGALLGSGAFSSVEATRDVEVNVTTDIVNAENPPDVLLDVGSYQEVAVADSIGGTRQDPTTLAPSDSDLNGTGLSGDSYVSLVANDVTIVFGYEDSSATPTDDLRLPANSLVTFNGLIGFAQGSDAADPSDQADMAFESEISGSNSSLTDSTVEFVDADSGNLSGSDISNYPENVEQSAGSSTFYNVSVDTQTADDSANEEFGIAIGDSDVSTIF